MRCLTRFLNQSSSKSSLYTDFLELSNAEAEHTKANKKVGCHATNLQQVLPVLAADPPADDVVGQHCKSDAGDHDFQLADYCFTCSGVIPEKQNMPICSVM
jgi:hypothetical protein